MDWTEAFWAAVAILLILEGFLPFASPSRWRSMMSQIAQLRDGQIRFFGLLSILVGLVILLVL